MSEESQERQNVQAKNNSVAVGKVEIAGPIGGDFFIGNKGLSAKEVSALITQIKTTFEVKPFDGRCPYKGLDVFDVEDAELFFGRERVVEDLLSRVKGSRAVFITGPSGSGKSSLVRAGLIHALKKGTIDTLDSEGWLYETLKPGRDPLEALALVFSRLKSLELARDFREHVNDISILNLCAESVLSGRTDQRFVLFVDQFEEVFTQVGNEETRVLFLKVLTDALAVENGRVIILLAMRSDFVSNCATYPALNAILNQPSAFAQIGAMQPDELVSAIAQPALRVGLQIDPDLIAQIITDMRGEPGALPLMQFALKDLFDTQQAKGGVIALTRADYFDRGGIQKSLERHADAAFAGLNQHEQDLARTIFSGLIEIGSGTQDTRRTALSDDLVPAGIQTVEVEAVVQKLADARLITTDEQAGQDTITISHEKLIDAWPWLKKLVNENRDVIAVQNDIAEDAREWKDHGQDSSYLYTGARLINAQEKLTTKRLVLGGVGLEFLNAGLRKQWLTRLIVVTGIAIIIVTSITAAYVFQRQKAGAIRSQAVAEANQILAEQNAEEAKRNAEEAEAQSKIALARQLGAQATIIQNDKRDLAVLLGAQAYKLDNNFETRGSLLSTIQCCSDALISFLSGHEDSVWDVAFSPDGKFLASGGNDGSIIIWDVATRQQIRRLKNHYSSATIYTLAFSPTDKILAAGDGTGAITLYNTETWQKIPTILRGHGSSVLSVKFSGDGKYLVSGGTDGKVIIWTVADRTPSKTFMEPTSWVWDVAISQDNSTVAAVGRDAIVHLWDLNPEAEVAGVEVSSNPFYSAAFNDDHQFPLLLTGRGNGNVVAWDMRPWLENRHPPTEVLSKAVGPGTSTVVWGLSFIPGDNFSFVTGRDIGYINRNRILLNESDDSVTLKRESLGLTGNNIGVFRIDVSPDGKLIAAAGQDGLVSLWNANEMTSVIRHASNITNFQIVNNTPNLVISLDKDGEMYRWDYDKQNIITRMVIDTSGILKSAISSDGTRVVTGYGDGTIILWDGQTGKKLSTYSKHQAPIASLVFSQDGNQLASSDEQGTVILWNVIGDDKLGSSLPFTDTHHSSVPSLLFSPDGSTLIGGGCGYPILLPVPDCSQGAVYVWDTKPQLKLHGEPLPGKSGFAWSMALNPANPDELAVGTRDGTVTIWDLKTRTTRLTFRLGKSDITSLAFNPVNNLLAVGADGFKVFLYNTHTGQIFGQAFREHDGPVTVLAFAPDGNKLLSASTNITTKFGPDGTVVDRIIDGTIVIHNMNPADWLSRACQIANRNLTRAEWKQYIGEALTYEPVCPDLPFEP